MDYELLPPKLFFSILISSFISTSMLTTGRAPVAQALYVEKQQKTAAEAQLNKLLVDELDHVLTDLCTKDSKYKICKVAR